MKSLLFAAFFVAGAYAVTNPNHWAFANKVVNMGVKLVNNKTIYNASVCMDPFFYNCSTMAQLQAQGQKCALAYAGPYFNTAYSIYTALDKCLSNLGDSVMALATNLMSSNSDLIGPIFQQGVTNIKKWKSAGQNKATCLESFYKWGANQFNKTIINTYCTNFVKSGQVTPAQWKCLVSAGKSALDLTPYKCATMVPPTKG